MKKKGSKYAIEEAYNAETQPKRKRWEDISFIQPEKSDVEKLNETFSQQVRITNRKIQSIRQQIQDLFGWENPSERVIMEQRLDFLTDKINEFLQSYNPFQAHPGLFLDISLTSVKRRKITISSLSNATSRFISRVSRGFTDAAYHEYHNKKAEKAVDKHAFSSAS